jgi:lipopolysaccharide transport system permease protein
MVWRDVKVKYKQTLLGMAWAVIQPVMTMLVFTFLFDRGKTSDGRNSLSCLFIHGFAAVGLVRRRAQSGQSFAGGAQQHGDEDLLPAPHPADVSVFAGLVDFAIAFVILIGLMFYYQVTPAWNLLWTLPLFLLLAIVTALGVALWLSAINVQYRDVNQALPFLTQFWLFATPVAYSASVISAKWQILYSSTRWRVWSMAFAGRSSARAMVLISHFGFQRVFQF